MGALERDHAIAFVLEEDHERRASGGVWLDDDDHVLHRVVMSNRWHSPVNPASGMFTQSFIGTQSTRRARTLCTVIRTPHDSLANFDWRNLRTQSSMASRRRLSRRAITEAALRIADREGLRGVTMRNVAIELDASPMAMYRHFSNKEALLDHMLERIVERVFGDTLTRATGWQDVLKEAARHARAELRAHPNWLPLLTRPIAPSSAIAIFERFAATMARDHVSMAAKLDAITSLMCFTLGFVLVEQMMRHSDGQVVPIEQLRHAREVGLVGFPFLDLIAPSFDRWSFDGAFESGLHALVGDIESSKLAS